jgi:NTP pyrophosphatase (non-canonical NTP hydrolase)
MFKPLQARVDAWISPFEEGYFHPLTNMARLSEEVGELAREVNHRFGQKTKKAEEAAGDMAMEMADISSYSSAWPIARGSTSTRPLTG